MKVHFIAIGGSAMHNLAIALSRKGMQVTGSDDEIFEPSKSRLKREGILPNDIGWDPSRITDDLDAVILGMHARENNPELIAAKEKGIPVYSYPEYLYEQSKEKTRVVIGGSHGKTTITSMILHVVNALNLNVDYMVGAQLEGYDCMVKITEDAPVMILEGDEYLSSPIDRRPKFHLYQPDIAIISGIAWDHINVFPTYKNYVEQFNIFCQQIEQGGTFVFNAEDEEVTKLGDKYKDAIQCVSYETPDYEVTEEGTLVHFEGADYPMKIFGAHNLQNLMGAMRVGEAMGISPNDFLTAMHSFTGAGKRLQKVTETEGFTMYKDFAHSPSKLKATTKAVKEQYPDRDVVACMELHTFSSLKKEFLPEYDGAMNAADDALVYFSPEVVAHKKLEPITKEQVAAGFGGTVKVVNKTQEVLDFIHKRDWKNKVLLMMSSGNFDGIDYEALGEELKSQQL
ncbi:MAG: Mur ligase family protein [bacterium]|nr:Mur ligase family protein [bacterium]